MKKTLALLLAAVMLLSVLAACSGKQETPAAEEPAQTEQPAETPAQEEPAAEQPAEAPQPTQEELDQIGRAHV